MPIYEYVCDNCAEKLEVIQRISEPPLSTCPSCNQKKLNRIISQSSFTFKGSGWYVSDYKPTTKKDTEAAPETESKKIDKPVESKKTDSSTESKKEKSKGDSGTSVSKNKDAA